MTLEELKFELVTLKTSPDRDAMAGFLEHALLADIAEAVSECLWEETLTHEDILELLMLMPLDERAKIYGHLSLEIQSAVGALMEAADLASIVELMPHDERADLYNELTPEVQETLLPDMSPAERADIEHLAGYGEGTVGSVMTSDYATVDAVVTAAKGIAQLRKTGADKETIYQAYVLDEKGQLVGSVSLRDLIMSEPDVIISDFMKVDLVTIRANDSRELAAQLVSKYDLLALPVVDELDRMVGILTYDDAMDVAAEETEIDFRKSSAIGDMVGGLREATVTLLYRKRVFWLVLLVFGNIFSGAGIAYFEDTIAAYVALVFFLPLLVDSGGNAGSQSATLMVRALATGEVMMKDWGGMLLRELMVAGLLGLTMAAAVSLLGVWRGGMEIALVVALTMQLVVVVGSVIGMSLPFLLNRLKFDPATASAPLITSIADAAGVLIYFSMATWILDIPAGLAA